MKYNNINIIVSSYNEEGNIEPIYKELLKYLIGIKYDFNIIYVNDGSTDKTLDNIKNLIDNYNGNFNDNKINVKISFITYEKNRGHEYAMIKGIMNSDAKYVIVLDCDLQHPPRLIPEIINSLDNGYDAIFMKRTKNMDSTVIKRITSTLYYKLINFIKKDKLIEGASDFFAFNNDILEEVKKMDFNNIIFLRRTIQKLSKNKKIISFVADKRYSGHSHYSMIDLFKLAIKSIKD